MEGKDKCQRCQIKPIAFYCENCKPFNLYCSQCDTCVHSFPLRMNHLRKQIVNTINQSSPILKHGLMDSDSILQNDIGYPYPSKDNYDIDSAIIYQKQNGNSNSIKETQQLEIENKKLKQELLHLSHLKTEQENIKDDLESYYDTKLEQLSKDNIVLKNDNERLTHESTEQSCIITQLKNQIEQINNQLKEQNKEIQTRKEKYRDLEGFYRFKFEEMQKEKDYLINQIRHNNNNYAFNNYDSNLGYNNIKSNYKEYGSQLPIKENNKDIEGEE